MDTCPRIRGVKWPERRVYCCAPALTFSSPPSIVHAGPLVNTVFASRLLAAPVCSLEAPLVPGHDLIKLSCVKCLLVDRTGAVVLLSIELHIQNTGVCCGHR